MNLKQWLIKQFGSKEFVESRMTSIFSPQEHGLPVVETTPPMPEIKAPDISPPARELAEAIESGKVKLYKTEEGEWTTFYKSLGLPIEFLYNGFNGKLNTRDYAFTEDEAKLLGQALRTHNAKEALAKKAETRNEIAEYLNKTKES